MATGCKDFMLRVFPSLRSAEDADKGDNRTPAMAINLQTELVSAASKEKKKKKERKEKEKKK